MVTEEDNAWHYNVVISRGTHAQLAPECEGCGYCIDTVHEPYCVRPFAVQDGDAHVMFYHMHCGRDLKSLREQFTATILQK